MYMVPLRKPTAINKSGKTYRKELMKSKSGTGQQLSAGGKRLTERFVNRRHSRRRKGDVTEYSG